MPEKFPPAPVNEKVLNGPLFSHVWQAWFRDEGAWMNTIRQQAFTVYTAGQELTTRDMGKTLIFDTSSSNIICYLPHVASVDLYSWVTVVRLGTKKLSVVANDSDKIENGRSIWCDEANRLAANLTFMLVEEARWAILSGTGIWKTA